MLELLTVMVILAIVALISFPIVVKMIDHVRKEFILASLNSMKVSAEHFYTKNILSKKQDFWPFTCGYGKSIDGVEVIFSCKDIVEMEEIEPTSGIMKISSNGNVTFQGPLKIEEYMCEYALNGFICENLLDQKEIFQLIWKEIFQK